MFLKIKLLPDKLVLHSIAAFGIAAAQLAAAGSVQSVCGYSLAYLVRVCCGTRAA